MCIVEYRGRKKWDCSNKLCKGWCEMIKKLTKGISNYEKLVEDGYQYVDKT